MKVQILFYDKIDKNNVILRRLHWTLTVSHVAEYKNKD